MIELTGKYTNAKIFANNVEPDVIKQVNFLCNHPLFEGKKIRIMPDCHPSKASVVGLVCEIDLDHIIPQLIGNDIGCAVSGYLVEGKTLNDYNKLDKVIKNLKVKQKFTADACIDVICNRHGWSTRKYLQDIGGIGGGNHFLSLEQTYDGRTYLINHSGSRTLGYDVGIHYAKLALEQNTYKYKEEKQLSWLNEESSKEYLEDMRLLMNWVSSNHAAIAKQIAKEMKWKCTGYHQYTVHNYIDVKNKILHKGSIDLLPNDHNIGAGSFGIIPINMADGSLMVTCNFNEESKDWLYSCPHGAGRLIKRSEAKEVLNLKEYKERMKNVYSSNINAGTIDESPMAYKSIEDIEKAIGNICYYERLKPVYNYKN